MSDGPQAWVFDIQRFSVHDGPGIRTTVFLKGCPLRCAWCQNPESQRYDPQLMLHGDVCIACGACAEACPRAEGRQAGRPLRPADCVACGQCADVCPTAARRIAGRRVDLDEVVDAVLRDSAFYGEAGGVTCGGGEPLVQWPFVRALAHRLHAEGVHVAVDTAGAAPRRTTEELPRYVDLVIADVKLVTPEAHRQWTGADNAVILEAVRYWSGTMRGRLWISVPLVPGVQDEREVQRIAAFIASLEHAPPVRLIPYHRLGDSKYAALGRPIPSFPGSVQELEDIARRAFHSRGVRVLS